MQIQPDHQSEQLSEQRSQLKQPFSIQTIKKELIRFIQTFKAPDRSLKYKQESQELLCDGRHSLVISLSDFMNYNNSLCQLICQQFYKYQPHMNQAYTEYMIELEKNTTLQDNIKSHSETAKEQYTITFNSGYVDNSGESVRQLKSDSLGKLRSFRATVTRTSQVRPELLRGLFRCSCCGRLSQQVPQQFKYTQPKKCLMYDCQGSDWNLDQRKSIFADFQKIRVQQDPSKIPPGAMPRSIDVILRNDLTQKAQPGDIVHLVGYLCVAPQMSSMFKAGEKAQLNTKDRQTRSAMSPIEGGIQGIKGIRQLSYRLIFMATYLIVQNNQFCDKIELDKLQQQQQNSLLEMLEEQEKAEKLEKDKTGQRAKKIQSLKKQLYSDESMLERIYKSMNANELLKIKEMRENPTLYSDLAESLFSSIFGHAQIKKALLLQLFGGVHKVTQNKINIRGDINVLIVGDPSTAKSQFLKSVNKFVPRSVYTAGKTSTAAGLTASVTKDQNGNVSIEAGALMLADNGICCIDQFDKMQIKDQVAIHQAMQQQTISIAKAGVHATLNARTSILAAANPHFGRYDKTRSLRDNINLSAPIMSRFDMFFIICDEANDLTDINLSRFMVDLHWKGSKATKTVYDIKTIKQYISLSKKFKPRLTLAASELLRKYYIQIRLKDKQLNKNASYRVTVRQLESMIRLSQAYAKLELDLYVKAHHVNQAYRLLACSITKIQRLPFECEIQDYDDNNIKSKESFEQIQMNRRKQQKKLKKVTIAQDQYEAVQKNIIRLFKQNAKLHSQQPQEFQSITHDAIITYLLGCNYDNGLLDSIVQMNKMKRLYTALIDKLIRQQRMLIVLEQTTDTSKRIIGIHPNYSF